jgi:hypothetical protein
VRFGRHLFIGVAAWTCVGALGGPAAASCAPPEAFPEAIKNAPAAFVGTVTGTANRSRWATVRVEEVWKGTELAEGEEVEVRAGPKDPPGPGGSATSVDRAYRTGTRYLFVPYKRPSHAIFTDNACTRTSEFRPRLERFRPELANTPESPGDRAPRQAEPADNSWVPTALIVVFGVLIIGRRTLLQRRSSS